MHTNHLYNYVPVALGVISLVTLAMTTTSTGICWGFPDNFNITFKKPSDSNAEYLDWVNSTQESKKNMNYELIQIYMEIFIKNKTSSVMEWRLD